MRAIRIEDRWIIEVSGQALGMVIRDESAYVFHAAAPEIWSLDRHIFRSLGAAERAVKDLFYARPAGKS